MLLAPRVVLDTQVFLRGALAKTQSLTARIYDAWRGGEFVLLMSTPILTEVEAVATRVDVLRKLRATPREAHAVMLRLRRHAVLVHPERTIAMSRDPTDDKFLEGAVAGRADCLVSADHDLLVLGAVEGIPIIDIATFCQQLERPRT